MKRLVLLTCLLGAFAMTQGSALACWDNTDQLIVKMKKLDLTTEQLKDVFQYQKQHRDLITKAHQEHLGCRYHEDHEVQFQKMAYGVLSDGQFQKLTGRARNETETLRYKNYKLQKENEKLKRELARLKAKKAEQNG